MADDTGRRYVCIACGEERRHSYPRGPLPRRCPSCGPAPKIRTHDGSAKWCPRCESDTERTLGNGDCKPCARRRKRAWYEANRNRVLDVNKRYRTGHADTVKATKRRYRQANVDPIMDAVRRRRALKHAALVHDVPAPVVWEYNPAGPGCCNYCRTPLSFDERSTWHVDHVVPLSRGGLHEIGNLVIACASCNLTKHDKLLSEWRPAS